MRETRKNEGSAIGGEFPVPFQLNIIRCFFEEMSCTRKSWFPWMERQMMRSFWGTSRLWQENTVQH